MKHNTSSGLQVTKPIPVASCGCCCWHIGKALSGHPGVTSMDVSLPSRSGKVRFDAEPIRIETIANPRRMSRFAAEMPKDQE